MGTEAYRGFDEIFDRPATSDVVLEAEAVTVRFGGVVAVDDVDLTVGRHDTVMLIGPNGAGKSTVLNALSGAVPSTGRVCFDGRELDGVKSFRRVSAGLGRSFQEPALIEHQSVIENVMAGAHTRLRYGLTAQLLGLASARRMEREHLERAHLLLDLLGIGREADQKASSLPYGTRKLVDIARAAVAGPKLLLLDEPSSGLDHKEREAVQSALLALREARCVAVIAVEHHMELVRAVATHVVALEAGCTLLSGTPDEVLGSDTVRSALTEAASLAREPEAAATRNSARPYPVGDR
ncbi:MAG: hypothetical protein ABS81_09655 [Pseudonocardia sp. SCN 72-86]|nr:MAG: hypothetical protein ABS81_09655 [Pseudonocardia sp. SCN 72-86]